MSSVNREFGDGLAVFADDDHGELERLPLGIAPLDWLILGGIPLGKVTMFRGPESGTKTTLAVMACSRYLARFPDKLAIYIDAEEKYPRQFVKKMGIDGSRFCAATPETAEKTIDFIEHSLRDKHVGILVLDSIAGMIPKIEIEAAADEWQRGLAARLMNKMIRKIVEALKSARLARGSSPTVILINQERINLSVKFGDPRTIPGGEGQKFACTLSVRLRSLTIKKAEDRVQEDAPLVKIAATVVKNSFGPKGRGAEYLMAMEDFGTLHPGDARDEWFVYLKARQLGLVEPSDDPEQEVFDRGQLYRELKASIQEAQDKKTTGQNEPV